ncbi:methyltransferase domain-containing protein [Clostridium pasteurianum DSM 525 = ATCC 6013]|uniref:Methyltransferase domain-containing protein n=1 Tax=Clostridium pasteurianum DSM 525 = ATCC 6013 TaxID=1262449 RepID=A0A0H3IYV4_CLOPA|nr:SAM-dependent methyltransferase [Clostridium pasteurianum]AJA46194.1 methyltransferase domain-containing protein [Clostridium pasteurianum DSM 525 = ATCC 6013]AJA50182.1 methyltransferase domain-containing protein [Clostridium pasteurianum DSM 525 = ATCC 6013]AOZ73651.1 SAM-dependent methyltransferase [Clostridium pasteurianum DSM 525 = ATCC 6013]AOZ77448.1 SAM-dependent methyltransferase [Clostridium pasteurianum]ELP57449.1 SAM dependent methyltransferase [Clostridium pasteurianum DSM 525 
MNKQSLNKLKLFLIGIKSRFETDNSTFNSITVSYTAGLKNFNGNGTYYNDKIKYNFNGKTELLYIDELIDKILIDSNNYESLSLIYSERGSNILISADNKNVKMSNLDIKESKNNSIDTNHTTTTSSLLNRNYYIKVGKADKLLKELNIMSKDYKIRNDKIRKYNQIDHYVELLEGIIDKLPKNNIITILDCGCGKSYLTFVLNYYFTEVKKIKCYFIGLDHSEEVIKSSQKMAENLDYRNMEFKALDIKQYKPDKKINVVISLHACDTATDMAIALGIKIKADAIIAVPCCHKEFSSQYKYEPFKDILKHGVFKTRLADVLTDGMRSLMLEAKGYDVSIVEYISPLETPKNLMIRAIKIKEENENAFDSYIKLMSDLNVYPALYDFLNN